MSNFSPTPLDRQTVVSLDETRLVLFDPITGQHTVLEDHVYSNAEDTAVYGIPQDIVEHPVIAGTTVREDNAESNPRKPEKDSDHSLLKGLGIVAASAYVVTSAGNAFLLHRGLQGPVDTAEMLSQVPGFYKNWIDFIGKLV